jgi:hypothetical protein
VRVVVLRSGWMSHYAGERPGDEAPVGGGAYNQDNLGHERFNFKEVGGRVYGYFQSPNASTGGLNLARISPEADGEDRLDGVLAIFIAKHPEEGGQRVVGWYRDATAHASHRPAVGDARADCGYQVESAARSAVLLPLAARTWTVPTSKGGMLRTHVRYPYTEGGDLEIPDWLGVIADRIGEYEGPSAMLVVDRAVEDAATEAAEEALSRRGAPGFQSDATIRRALELHAMVAATRYFEARGWEVDDHHSTQPYDLLIKKKGRVVRVEVKGTTGDGSAVLLTRGEVESARRHPSALIIVHSIEVTPLGRARGGTVRVRRPWVVDPEGLTALSYLYRPG